MTDIRFRVRGPGWVEDVTATPHWTVQQLLDHLKTKQGAEPSALKYGRPLKDIDLSNTSAFIQPLNLNREAITFVPKEDASASASASASGAPEVPVATSPAFMPKNVEPDATVVEWPEKDGYLVLRVMPDDNSCMFTAFGGVLQRADPAPALRREVAAHILAHPAKFDAVVLEMDPQRYARALQDPQRWGGAIELGVLSDLYDIEICSVDVQTQRVDRYGEAKATRCLLLYSGIHYDRIAFTAGLSLPAEFDAVRWDADDDAVLLRAQRLAKQLKDQHYFTDTATFVLKCDAPNCGWVGAGLEKASKHMMDTGHQKVSEMQIT